MNPLDDDRRARFLSPFRACLPVLQDKKQVVVASPVQVPAK